MTSTCRNVETEQLPTFPVNFPSMTDECKYVGHDVQRNDIVEKCTGRLRYLADRPDGGVVHARHILSSVANGRVISIDPTEALKVPGVIKVYTPADDPGETYNSAIFLPDQVDLRDERVFTDRPIFVGDVIGAVVAETDHAARVAASLVQIQYETYDPVIDMVAALEAPSFREGFPQVLEGCISYGDGPPKNAIHFESTVTTPKIHHSAMENHICQASLEYGDVLLVESPCQMIFTIRYVLSELFHRPINRIRVVKSPMGGTFGAKQEVLLEPACALIAMDLARPVRLSMDRRETIIGTRTRAATRGTVTTFVDKEGNFLHRDIRSITDAGAYTSGGHRVTMAMGKKASRLYTLPSQKFVGKTTFTNTTPNGACRGYGSPQIHTITEIHIDLLARHIGMDPVEIRMKNLVHPGDPDPAGGTPLGNARIRDCLRLGAEAFQWTERRDLSLVTDRYRQGVGLACCTHGNGYYGSPFPDFLSMAMRFCEDGTVLVNASLHELGNGTLTVIGQIVGEILSIDPTMIHVTEGDTQTTPFDVGCVASRVTYVCGPCALDLAEKLRERFIGQISRVLQVEQQSVQMNAGRVIVPELGEWGYGEMVCRIAKELREEVGEYHQYAPRMNPASYGVNFAEVQVDTLTGLIQVTDFLAVHDVGKAINPAMVRGQIYGGIQMGIGMALTEELVYDKQGHPKSDSLSRYHMINAPDMPPIQVMLVEEYEPGGPFGAKSIGEISTVPTAAAVVNAVNRALGTSMTDLPLTPERVLQAIEHTRREE